VPNFNRLIVALGVLVLSGCSILPKPLSISELSKSIAQDRQIMFAGNEEIVGELTLHDAIARAFTYNLDHKAKAMEQALALNQIELDQFELLPTLTANAGYKGRSEFNATRSKDVDGATPSGAYSYSSDRSSTNYDLTMNWNILDFGVSYFAAKQNADRALIANERRRKVLYNILKEVEFSFWRMVAAQKLKTRIKDALMSAGEALQDSEQVEAEKIRSPIESLRFQKRLLTNMRRLRDIDKDLSTARIELAALINLPPSASFRVVEPESDELEVPQWDVPLGEMESLAFHNNPDIHEKLYLTRISVDETRRAIASLMPGLNLTAGFNRDSNSFMDENSWAEWSTALSFNIMNFLKVPALLDYSQANETVADVQRLALRMAVLAQVHIAERQFVHTVSNFRQADKMYRLDRRLADYMKSRQSANAQGALDRISQDIEAIASEMRRYQAYSEIAAAIGNIHSTLGVGVVPSDMPITDLPSMIEAVRVALADRKSGKAIRMEIANLEGAGGDTAMFIPAKAVVASNEPAKTELFNAPTGTLGIAGTEQPALAKTPQAEISKSSGQIVEPSQQIAPLAQGEPTFSIRLSDQMGGTTLLVTNITCSSVRVDETRWGSVKIRGRDQMQNEVVGWVHEIFYAAAKESCLNTMQSGL